MNNKLLEFCRKYKQKLSDTAAWENYNKSLYDKVRDFITRDKPETSRFTVYAWRSSRHRYFEPSELFDLDDEDLEYLFNKYSKKLFEECEQEKQRIDELYSKAIGDLVV